MIRLIGADPGFANLGLAEVELLPLMPNDPTAVCERVMRAAAFKTQKSKDKGVRTSEDEMRRVMELARTLDSWLANGAIAVCMEEQGNPPKAQWANMRKMHYPVPMIWSVAAVRRVPVLMVPSKQIKLATTGSKTATKQAVQAALEARYGAIDWQAPPSKQEHPSDALGAIVASLDYDVIQMARRLALAHS
jgi:Holliday junction resolvasome RuvABC endonuclease subunit